MRGSLFLRILLCMFTSTTHNIKVTATPHFLTEQSTPSEAHYVWAYTIELENLGTATVQLLRRHWHITDAQGLVTEVEGEGVVGEQPVLRPGDAFRYTSGTSLPTASGIMLGEYTMRGEAGESFAITIPAFSLDSPYQVQRLN